MRFVPYPRPMQHVEVSYEVQPTSEEIRENLSPEEIVEHSGIYEIKSRTRTGDGEEIVVGFEDVEMTLKFSAIEGGYEYEAVGDSDFFAERYSKITVGDSGGTTITAECRYTVDSMWSFLLDRMAAKSVQSELETLITNLATGAHSD